MEPQVRRVQLWQGALHLRMEVFSGDGIGLIPTTYGVAHPYAVELSAGSFGSATFAGARRSE